MTAVLSLALVLQFRPEVLGLEPENQVQHIGRRPPRNNNNRMQNPVTAFTSNDDGSAEKAAVQNIQSLSSDMDKSFAVFLGPGCPASIAQAQVLGKEKWPHQVYVVDTSSMDREYLASHTEWVDGENLVPFTHVPHWVYLKNGVPHASKSGIRSPDALVEWSSNFD